MTIRECYDMMNGDYEDVLSRLMKEERIIKFALKFPNDTSYNDLISAVADGKYDEAFRAAHTLKGVAQNLGFTYLSKPSSEITELLRNGKPEGDISEIMKQLSEAYNRTIDAIKAYSESLN